ncbi:MAG: response regulator [Magnetococcus sp. YQC-5]
MAEKGQKNAARILIVDDLAHNRTALTEILKQTQAEVIAVASGNEALALCTRYAFALILLDVSMPVMDGFEVATLLRMREQTRHLPILFISGQVVNLEQLVKGYASGAVDFILKPVDSQILLSKAKVFLELYHQKRMQEHYIAQLAEQKKQLENEIIERNRVEQILVSMLDAVFVLSAEGLILRVNRGELHGSLDNELIGQFIGTLFADQGENTLFSKAGLTRLLQTGSVRNTEASLLTKEGGQIPVLLSASVMRDAKDGIDKIILIVKEIAEYKQAQQSLQEKEAQLLAAHMAHQATNAFLANMSHEMRTPLNAISGLTELALRCDVNAKVRDYLSKVAHSASILSHINNDILDFSKIGAGRLDIEPVSFDPLKLFNKLGEMLGGQAADKGLELLFFIPEDYFETLFGDCKRLEQILLNILRNVIQWTTPGALIVRAHPHPRQVGPVTLHFSVEDTGGWIKPERVGSLFAPLTQAPPSMAIFNGETALELTICKQLVEMMGGRIWTESLSENIGVLHFTVQFEYQSAIQQPLIVPACLRGIHILVVDDHALTREVIVEMLKIFSFSVASVDSGEAALEELLAAHAMGTPCHLVFMDWRMPGMDGIQTVRKIHQAFSERSDIPKIIMLTAFGKHTIQESAEQSGIHGFIHKPVTRVDLFNAILEVFGERVLEPQHPNVAVLNEELEAAVKIRGARVLLAEDNRINQLVARELLERVGVTVEVVDNGQEAVQRLESSSFDAVLMDVQMPVMDGHTATRTIRKNPKLASLPIIAMTAHVQERARAESVASGMNDHIIKPIDIKQLYGVLTRWIHPEGIDQRCDRPLQAVESRRVCATGLLPAVMEGIDLKGALLRLGGQEAFLKSMLLRFKKHANVCEQIQAALQREDFDTAGNLAHMMTGIAGNLSAIRLQKAAHALEKSIELGRIQQESSLIAEFNQALQQVLGAIQGLESMNTRSGAMVPPPPEIDFSDMDYDLIAPILKELSSLLALRDTDAELTLETLKQVMQRKNWHKDLQKVEERMQKMDYPGAQMFLKKIQNSMIRPVRE